MTSHALEQQLTKYLTDAHSIERQAIAQLQVAPKLAGDEEIAALFVEHLHESETHERLVEERLRAREAKPSSLKDLAGVLTGRGFTSFARSQPDTPGKLVVHAFSYEHMEEAAYELLAEVAQRAGDGDTVAVAQLIEQQESAMGDRLAGCFDLATEASLRVFARNDLDGQLDKYLADAHAIEAQALQLLARGPSLAGVEALASVYEQHRAETVEHQRLVAERLSARGAAPSKLKDGALRIGALNWGAFFQAQPDTPAKLAAFSYAFEHLEVGAYEMLGRVAERAGDPDTQQVAARILGEERAAAESIRSLFGEALDAALDARGVGAR